MAKRGPKPKIRKIVWNARLAYAVGLFATDGCLYANGRHLEFTSKDKEQVLTFRSCLQLPNLSIKRKSSGSQKVKKYYRVQFSDSYLYQWFLSIGIAPRKSKTIAQVRVPSKLFFDFFRGVLDGDGSFHSYYDPRWKSSYMFYLAVASASPLFIEWLQTEVRQRLGISGHVTQGKTRGAIQLRYAKSDSLKIIKKVYYSQEVPCLARKRAKIFQALARQDT